MNGARPVPGLTRDLNVVRATPDHVRGGICP